MNTLKELYNYIIGGGIFEHIDFDKYEEVNCPCECIRNDVYEDENFNEFMRELNASEIERTKNEIIFSDGETTISVTYEDYENRFDEMSADETIMMFDNIMLV